jgi:hypothetical protein
MLSPSGYDTNASAALYRDYAHYLAGSNVTVARVARQCEIKSLSSPATAHQEVFTFDPPHNQSDWLQMDWEQVTTIALSDTHVAMATGHPWPPQMNLYCHAHANGVKIVQCVTFNQSLIPSVAARSTWVAARVAEALKLGTDGISVEC